MPLRLVRRLLVVLALLIQMGSYCGCASRASLPHLRPAEHSMAGVRRIALLPVAGPAEPAEVAQQALLDTLNGTGRYRLIGPAELQLASPLSVYQAGGSVDRDAVLAAARRSRADAVLLAAVAIQEQEGNPPGGLPFLGAGPQATVTCRLEVIDVRSGQTLLADQVELTHDGTLSDSPGDPNLRTRVYQQLASQAATAAVRKFTPHHVTSEVPLVATTPGESSAALRQGNSLAREGRWDEALRLWRGALVRDPENHGAMYSVGLAFEAQGDFRRAQEWYRKALERSEKTLYREALARVRAAAEDYQLAQTQIRNSRETLPASPAWRQPWSDHPYGSTTSLAAGWRTVPELEYQYSTGQLADVVPPGPPAAQADALQPPPFGSTVPVLESRVPARSGHEPLHR